jgi:hypothetical protein
MSRGLTAAAAEIVGWVRVPIVFLAEFEFDPQTIRLWSGAGTLPYNGNDYTGLGGLTGLMPYNETQDLTAQGMGFQLTGVPQEYIALALQQNPRRRPCRLQIAFRKQDVQVMYDSSTPVFFDATNYEVFEKGNLFELVDSPYTWFRGLMNTMPIEQERATAKITLTAENELIILKQRKVLRFTDEHQQAKYAGDTCFKLLAQNQDKVFEFGKQPS